MRQRIRSLLIFLCVLLGSAGCDHASKRMAIAALGQAETVSLGRAALRLELIANPGAFLSFGAGLPEAVRNLVFIGMVPLFVGWLCVHVLRAHGRSTAVLVGLGLVAGGGLANWLDRLLHEGAVTDFIILGVGPVHTGVFNFADVLILVGVALLVFSPRGGRMSRSRRGT